MGRDAGVFDVGLKGQCDGRFVLTGVLARAARLLVAELARRQQLSHIASSTFKTGLQVASTPQPCRPHPLVAISAARYNLSIDILVEPWCLCCDHKPPQDARTLF